MSDHKRNRGHSPAFGSRKLHKEGPGRQSPYECSFQRSDSNERHQKEKDAEKIPKHPKVPSTRDLIIARFQGPLISASMEKTMKLRLQYLGAEHPDTLKVMQNLAEAWHRQQRYKECDGLRVHVLDATINSLGGKHESAIIAMERLGATRSRRGYDIECEKLEAQALQLRRQTAGTRHSETIKAMTNLASTWLYLDRNEIAEESLTSALKLSMEVLGERHENTIHAMVALGEVKRRFGNYADAERLLEHAYEMSVKLLGEGHVHTLAAQSQLARTWGNHGRFGEAEALHLESIEIHKKCLGEKHPNTLASRFHLAETLYQQGRYDDAEQIMSDVAMLRREVSGVIHPYTRRDANFLAEIRSKRKTRGSTYFGTVEEIFSDEEELIVIGNQPWHSIALKNCIKALQVPWRSIRLISEDVATRSPIGRNTNLFRKTTGEVLLSGSKLPTATTFAGNTEREKLYNNVALKTSMRPIFVSREVLGSFQTLVFFLLALIITYGIYHTATQLRIQESTPVSTPIS